MNDPLFALAQAVYRGDLPAARTALDAWCGPGDMLLFRVRQSLGLAEEPGLPVDEEVQARMAKYMKPVEDEKYRRPTPVGRRRA